MLCFVIRAERVEGNIEATMVNAMHTPTSEGKVPGSMSETGHRLQLTEEDFLLFNIYFLELLTWAVINYIYWIT